MVSSSRGVSAVTEPLADHIRSAARMSCVTRFDGCWRRMLVVVFLAVTFTGSACALSAVPDEPQPIDILLSWSEALDAGRAREAWLLLAPNAREGLDEQAFGELVVRDGDELLSRASELIAWAERHPPAERAVVDYGDRRFHLVRTVHGWRIVGNAALP